MFIYGLNTDFSLPNPIRYIQYERWSWATWGYGNTFQLIHLDDFHVLDALNLRSGSNYRDVLAVFYITPDDTDIVLGATNQIVWGAPIVSVWFYDHESKLLFDFPEMNSYDRTRIYWYDPSTMKFTLVHYILESAWPGNNTGTTNKWSISYKYFKN